MATDLVATLTHFKEEEAVDIVEGRLGAGEDPDTILDDARRAVEAIREGCVHSEYSIPDVVHSGEMLRAITGMVKPERAQEHGFKCLVKLIFCTVSGDINEIG
jgi:methanogenic corrinoid protein MtbC1